MTVTTGLHHALRFIQPSRAYASVLLGASWMIGSCVTSDFLDHWLRQIWRNRLVAWFWSQVHGRLWPF